MNTELEAALIEAMHTGNWLPYFEALKINAQGANEVET
jgi:hypothetical protein